MSVSYFGSSSIPADNGSFWNSVIWVIPPSAMQAGDLVVMVGQFRANSGITPVIYADGGQSWNSEDVIPPSGYCTMRIFWCIFNGTWASDPSIIAGSAGIFSLMMHVFRPTSTAYSWVCDVNQSTGSFSTSDPYPDITISGVSVSAGGTVVFATWGLGMYACPWILQTSGWANAGNSQYRNTSSVDHTNSSAYKIMGSAGSSGDVTNRIDEAEKTFAGTHAIIAFREYADLTIQDATMSTSADNVDVYEGVIIEPTDADISSSADEGSLSGGYPSTAAPRATLLGTSGGVYLFSGTNDDGNTFSAYWRSKDLDFSEELGIDATQALKTIDKVKLLYEDVEADTPIYFRVSIDGGNTWVTKSATIGTGDGASKSYEFDFSPIDAVTGYIFTFKIECPSGNQLIKWTGFSVDVIFRGIKFEIE